MKAPVKINLPTEPQSIPNDQLERIVALLTLGLVAALEQEVVTMDEAIQILFSPYMMRLLEAASVRESVISLVHTGSELEDCISARGLVRQKY